MIKISVNLCSLFRAAVIGLSFSGRLSKRHHIHTVITYGVVMLNNYK